MNESRTSKSIKNAQASLIYYCIQLLLGFFSRKVFFDYLGSEILGLNTTAANLLGFLNLAELGIGMSVGYFLYKPLYDHNTETLNKIIALQGWIYRRIAYIIIILACILMSFFPWIFEKSPLPLWYAYVTFGVLLFSSMLGYFANYRQILLQADQKSYKVQRITQGAIIVKTIIQIVGMQIVAWPFVFWTIMELGFAIFSAYILNYVLKKEYPWLQTRDYNGKDLLKEFPKIITKTKQVFVHKFSAVVLGQCAPLIMYGFSSLTIIAYYGNYQLIIGKVGYLLQTIFNSTTAGVGNLIASGNKQHIQDVFWELFDSRFFFSSVTLITIYFVIQPFITIWLGSQYILSDFFLCLILITTAISINRVTVDSFIAGYGLFSDIWAPIAETLINLGGSFLFGYFWGYEGVLIGVILSQFVIICLWKPYFLYSQGLQSNASQYFIPLVGRLFIITIDFIAFKFIFSSYNISNIDNYLSWFLFTITIFFVVFIILFAEFYFLTSGMHSFTLRIYNIIINKFKK